MRLSLIRVLDSPHAVRAATIVTLLLGHFFIFVWAPHPWSWQGIDAYHELAKALARGEPFPTTDVPWGYAAYAALFYRLVGDRIWVPLVVQATLNAAVPWMLFRLVMPLAGRRVAALSALIVGVFSFNTIYASTQASDAICTVLFLAALLWLARGMRRRSVVAFAVAGVLFGLVPQLRPNLVLLPAAIAVCYILLRRSWRAMAHMAVFAALALVVQMPWIIRNYRLTGLLLPTSTHGGVQLWYGTLQIGPFLESRAHNPRFYFATPAFTYTSMWWRPIEIHASHRNCFSAAVPTQLVYWTDRDRQPRRVMPEEGWGERTGADYVIRAQSNHTTLYYFFEQTDPAAATRVTTPLGGEQNPLVAFISDDHLADLDRHDDLLDMFDLVRMLRHIAWQEPLRAADKVDLNHDGRVDAADVDTLVTLAVPEMMARFPAPASSIDTTEATVTVRLADQSWVSVPRAFGGRQTDVALSLHGEFAPELITRPRTFTSLAYPARPRPTDCLPAGELKFNTRFYLSEPFGMQRYMALALDNIRREPLAFIMSSLYRIPRLFIVRGTDDVLTAQQFRWSSLVYTTGTVLSLAYLALFLAGVAVAWRRYPALLALLVPVAYIPLTICFVLTNMRYTVTVQPVMFAFVAVAIAATFKLDDATAGAGVDGDGAAVVPRTDR